MDPPLPKPKERGPAARQGIWMPIWPWIRLFRETRLRYAMPVSERLLLLRKRFPQNSLTDEAPA